MTKYFVVLNLIPVHNRDRMSSYWKGFLQIPWFIAALLVVGLALTISLRSLADSAADSRKFVIAREVMVAQKCGSCHTLQAAPLDWNATIGPDLTHQARRGRSPEWLRRHLKDPAHIPDGDLEPPFRGKQKLMPSFEHLSDKELDAVIWFLTSSSPR